MEVHQNINSGGKRKFENIETLRGLIIILVVLGHVIGVDGDGGMRVSDDSIWRYLYVSILKYMQMPVFTIIAGWVYALKPVTALSRSGFMKRKALRLLVPLVSVGTLYFIVQQIVPGTNVKEAFSSIWRIYIFPFSLYWYLPALFIVFAIVCWVDMKGWASQFHQWSRFFLFSLIIFTVETFLPSSFPNLFGFKGGFFLLPFFVLGIGMRRFAHRIATPRYKMFYCIGFIICLLLTQIEWFGRIYGILPDNFLHLTRLNLVVGLFAAAFVINLQIRNNFLIWIGGYAYSIYLFHAFGTAAGRIILTEMDFNIPLFIFLLSSVLGIFCPILLDRILNFWPLPRLVFLGKLKR